MIWFFVRERTKCQMLLSEGRPCFDYFSRENPDTLVARATQLGKSWISQSKTKKALARSANFGACPRLGPRRPSWCLVCTWLSLPLARGPNWEEWPKNPFLSSDSAKKTKRTTRSNTRSPYCWTCNRRRKCEVIKVLYISKARTILTAKSTSRGHLPHDRSELAQNH